MLLPAAAAGLVFVLATPPLPLGFLGWVGLVPLFKALERTRDRREAFRAGFTFGAVWHAATLYWVAWNSGLMLPLAILSAIGLVAAMALWMGVLATLHRLLLRAFGTAGHLLAPVLWMASDVFWQAGDWSFPWITLALTQGGYLEILQLASLGGSVLITGFVALLNGLLAAGGRRVSVAIAAAGLIAVVWIWGDAREREVHERTAGTRLATVAIVQGNIDPAYKWELGPTHSLTIYEALTSAHAADSIDVVVWPESAIAVYVEQNYRWRTHLQQFVDRLRIALVTGGRYADFDGDERIPYNAAFLVEPGARGNVHRYQKVFLVPFGERIPFQWIIPWLGSIDFGQAEFASGPGIKAWPMSMSGDTLRLSPLICYEAIFPKAGVTSVEKGADVLVNMTNDGWFTGTGEQEQHLLLSRIRSIETGRPLVRSTNTGISAFVSPSGRIMRALAADIRGVIVETLPRPVETPFDRGGHRIGWWALLAVPPLLLVAALIVALRDRRRRQ